MYYKIDEHSSTVPRNSPIRTTIFASSTNEAQSALASFQLSKGFSVIVALETDNKWAVITTTQVVMNSPFQV